MRTWGMRSAARVFTCLLFATPVVRADLAKHYALDSTISNGPASSGAALNLVFAADPVLHEVDSQAALETNFDRLLADDAPLKAALTDGSAQRFAGVLKTISATVAYDDPAVPSLTPAAEAGYSLDGPTEPGGFDPRYLQLDLGTLNGPGGGQDDPVYRVRRRLPMSASPAPGSIVLGVMGLAVVLRRRRS